MRRRRPKRQLVRNDRGAVTLEAVLIYPALLLALAASFVFFEAMNLSVGATRAAYTVADLPSRKTTQPVTAA